MLGFYWMVVKWTAADVWRRVALPFQPNIPQAAVHQSGLRSYVPRNWRTYFMHLLSGRGLEIGPLHQPMPTHDRIQMQYVDYLSVEDLRRRYPELHRLDLVSPDFIDDAQSLATIQDESFDFLVAAHVIEHMRNPLGALQQWRRCLRPGGKLYLVVPDKRCGFDRTRVRTTLEHLILDYHEPSSERDFEHFLDYAVHVQKARSHDAIEEAHRLVKSDYSIHFHVFLPEDVVALVRWFHENIAPLRIVEGPVIAAGSDEFHLLLERPR